VTVGVTGGTGNTSVAFTVAANSSTSSRSATLTVGIQTVTITQAGVTACSLSISASSQTFPASGGNANITVTAPPGCAWTPVSTGSWLTTGAGGNGSGDVDFLVAANPSSLRRTASITIGNQSLTITQAGVACTYSI